MISAVLLAAGESRRMGLFKQLLPFDGKTFVECCVDNLLASRTGEVIVVTGHREADLRNAVGGRLVKFAYNADYRAGMSASIKRGVEDVSKDTHGIMIALVDQPWIKSYVFNQVIEVYENNLPLIVIPTYAGKNGHPIILDASLKEEILAMDLTVGLRQVVSAHANQIARVEVASEEILIDCDFPEDYQRMLNE